MATPAFPQCLPVVGVRRRRRARRLANPASFSMLVRAGQGTLLEMTRQNAAHMPPDVQDAINQVCIWLSSRLEATSVAWLEAAARLTVERVRLVLRQAASVLQDEADWLVEDRGLETPDGQPERLVTAVEETLEQAARVLMVLEQCVGDGVSQAREAAGLAQEAANDAALKMRKEMEAAEPPHEGIC